MDTATTTVGKAHAKATQERWRAMEKRPCPECGRLCIREMLGLTILTDPPTHQERWWCQCGHEGEVESVIGRQPTLKELQDELNEGR